MKTTEYRGTAKLRKALRGATSAAVLLALLLGIAPAMAIEPTEVAADPFAEMMDEYPIKFWIRA